MSACGRAVREKPNAGIAHKSMLQGGQGGAARKQLLCRAAPSCRASVARAGADYQSRQRSSTVLYCRNTSSSRAGARLFLFETCFPRQLPPPYM